MYYWREGKFEVDFIVKLAGRLYAVEVKSGRKRRSDGLSAFISKYPNSVPLVINCDNGSMLLTASLVTNELLDSL